MAHRTVFHGCLLTGKTILKSRQYVEHTLPLCCKSISRFLFAVLSLGAVSNGKRCISSQSVTRHILTHSPPIA